MHPIEEKTLHSRRSFLASAASGIGGVALASMLAQDPAFAATPGTNNPLQAKAPHHTPKAKACIFIFMAGAPSQIDLFDPKPELLKMDGQKLPESFTEEVRFAFLQKDTAVIKGCETPFKKYGECGTEMSTMLPHIGSCADDIALIRSMHTEEFDHAGQKV